MPRVGRGVGLALSRRFACCVSRRVARRPARELTSAALGLLVRRRIVAASGSRSRALAPFRLLRKSSRRPAREFTSAALRLLVRRRVVAASGSCSRALAPFRLLRKSSHRAAWAIELVGSWDSARGVAASRLVAFVAC